MNKALQEQRSEKRLAPEFGDAEEHQLMTLFKKWREQSGLGASEERQFALLLTQLVASRAGELLEMDAFIRLMQPFGGEIEFSDEEKRALVRHVKPLVRVRELSQDEKDELATLFERYRMRLWSKLRRSIGPSLQSQFEPDDVLNDAYIRAETRWSARPKSPEQQYVWLYGIVHDQFCDMLRRVNAVKRGSQVEHSRIPDNSAAEIALELCRSQTGPSTIAARNEFAAKLQEFLERNLSQSELEIFAMRVFDRLEYGEIVTELVRRAEGRGGAADYQKLLAELDSRSSGGGSDEDVLIRRREAVRKRFTRAVRKLAGVILDEFPQLLDASTA